MQKRRVQAVLQIISRLWTQTAWLILCAGPIWATDAVATAQAAKKQSVGSGNHATAVPRKNRGFELEITVRHGGVGWSQEVVYKRPHQWMAVTHLRFGIDNIRLCDGHTAWAFETIDGEIDGDVRKWSIGRLVRELGKDRAYVELGPEALDGLYTVADPNAAEWADEFGSKEVKKELKRVGEGRLGAEPVVVWETGKGLPKMRLWFGKGDGILRRQITYDDKRGEVTRWVVTKVKLEPKVDDAVFRFSPPKGAEIRDETDELLKALRAGKGRPVEKKGARD